MGQGPVKVIRLKLEPQSQAQHSGPRQTILVQLKGAEDVEAEALTERTTLL